MSKRQLRVLWLSVATTLVSGGIARAQVATDGSVGPAVQVPGAALPGASFEIPAGWGEQSVGAGGANLFHSFREFNVPTAGLAHFTAEGLANPAAGVDHVIVRVTGETLHADGFRGSRIDGTIRSSLGESAFFLVNPRGVVFGADAALDVPGAFFASTASDVRLTDGGVFSASQPGASILTSAAPEAFGFLGPTVAPIEVYGRLETAPGKALALVGGDLVVSAAVPESAGGTAGYLSAPEGHVLLVSVASAGVVSGIFETGDGVVLDGFQRLGKIDIVDGAIVSSSGFTPTYRPFANPVTVGPLEDLVTTDLEQIGIFLLLAPGAETQPGDVFVTRLDFGGGLVRDQWFRPNPRTEGSGPITIRGGDLTIRDAELVATTVASDGGAIDVRLTGALVIDGSADSGAPDSGVLARTGLPVSGAAPNLGQEFEFEGSVAGAGAGGAITLEARNIRIGEGGIVSSTSSTEGRGGDVTLRAAELLDVRGRVFGNAQGAGDAGDVTVEAQTLRLSGTGGLFNQTTGNGNAGDVRITVEQLEIRDAAQVDNSTSAQLLVGEDGQGGILGRLRGKVSEALLASVLADLGPTTGAGGSIEVEASGSVLLSGSESNEDFARLSTFSKEQSAGRAGDIFVSAPRLAIEDGAGIAVTTSGAGQGGSIDVAVGELEMRGGARIDARSEGTGDAGSIHLQVSGSAQLVQSAITTEALQADGGDITLHVADTLELVDSEITASVAGGTGGNVTIDPVFVILDDSRIIARATTGAGGNIAITTDFLIASPDSAIDASSQSGVDGTVVLDTPDTDITGSLTTLPASFLQAAGLLRGRCAARSGANGSLSVAGPGAGMSPDGYLPAALLVPDPAASLAGTGHCPGAGPGPG